MAKVKGDTTNYKDKYESLWNDIERFGDEDKRRIVDGLEFQMLMKRKTNKDVTEFKEYMKTPLPYIGMIAGAAIPLIIVVIFLWSALQIE